MIEQYISELDPDARKSIQKITVSIEYANKPTE